MATDIVLKDRNGQDVTYSGIETVTFDTPIEGVQTTFTHGVEQTGKEVELALADGDQFVKADDGYLLKELTIKKPEGAGKVIAKGETLGGIPGEYVTPGTTKEIEPDFSEGDYAVTAEDDERWNKVMVKKPETQIPENIADGVNIGGVVGTFKGGGCDFDFSDKNVQFFSYRLDIENKQILLYSILYDVLYEVNGSYDVNIPDQIGGYDVVIVCR